MRSLQKIQENDQVAVSQETTPLLPITQKSNLVSGSYLSSFPKI